MSLLQSIQSKRLRGKVFKSLDLGAFLPFLARGEFNVGDLSTTAICVFKEPQRCHWEQRGMGAQLGPDTGHKHFGTATIAGM
jgi:hypothetical protein